MFTGLVNCVGETFLAIFSNQRWKDLMFTNLYIWHLKQKRRTAVSFIPSNYEIIIFIIANIFSTWCRISNEGAEALKGVCRGRGGILTEIETYDFKIGTSKEGKLDIRVKFNDGVPEAVRVKKSEYKVAIFDILCLHRYVPPRWLSEL